MRGSCTPRGNDEQPAVAEANVQRPLIVLRLSTGSQSVNMLPGSDNFITLVGDVLLYNGRIGESCT